MSLRRSCQHRRQSRKPAFLPREREESFLRGRDVGEEFGLAFHLAEKSVSPEGLHEPLHRALGEAFFKSGAGFGVSGFFFEGKIKSNEVVRLRRRELAVGIVDHRGEVILGQTPAQALVVDEVAATVAEHHVGALEIAVDECSRQGREFVAESGKGAIAAEQSGF
jgi:hypothetical protein